MSFSIYIDDLQVDLPLPTDWQMEVETMTASHSALNGSVKRERRYGAPSRTYRAAIRWDEISKAEADVIEGAWMYLVYDPARSALLVAPDDGVHNASIETGNRAFSREPFATGDGEDRFMVTLVLRLEQ